jgi:Ca2+-binding EF-hand superfamily protein
MFRTTLLATALSFCAIPSLAQPQDPIDQLLANFNRIDVNGNGEISRAEFRRVQAARWPQIDRNGDGYLSEEDFPTAAARRTKTQLAEIAHLDADGDGRISQSEFLNGPAALFTQADRNSDGVLTRAEVDVPAS